MQLNPRCWLQIVNMKRTDCSIRVFERSNRLFERSIRVFERSIRAYRFLEAFQLLSASTPVSFISFVVA